MFDITLHVRPNGSCPYDEYVRSVYTSGKKTEAAAIRALVDRLALLGSQRLVAIQKAEKMNDVWELRRGQHRIFYFWHAAGHTYVLLNGFRKKSRKAPPRELRRAENLMDEHGATRGRTNDGE